MLQPSLGEDSFQSLTSLSVLTSAEEDLKYAELMTVVLAL